MGKKPRDKTKVRKVKVPPVPNSGTVKYNLWLMNEGKEKGNHDKWGEPVEILSRNRKNAAKSVREMHPTRNWKLRLA